MNKQNHSFKRQIISFIATIIIILSLICVFLYMTLRHSNTQYNDLMEHFLGYNQISVLISNASTEFDNFIQTRSSDSFQNYMEYSTEALDSVRELKSNAVNEEAYYSLVALEELLQTYHSANCQIKLTLQNKKDADFYPDLVYSKELYSYLNMRIASVSNVQLQWINQRYRGISDQTRVLGLISLGLICVIFTLSTILSVRFSQKISDPINRLTEYARKISVCDFVTPDLCFNGISEIVLLTDSLNLIKKEISSIMAELEDKAAIEVQLREQQLKSLKIEKELRDTEYKMLMAQINPHFLFNTLNSIGRLAYFNGNKEIEKMIESLSDMLRYNLSSLDTPVSLSDELDNLQKFVYIQQVRFQGKLNVTINIASEHLSLRIPCMVLQPLVENAISHGLQIYDYSGNISVDVYDTDNCTIVKIADDGIGISSEILTLINEHKFQEINTSSTGLGLHNVITRVEAFYGSGCIHFSSEMYAGTTVELTIPNKEEKAHV